MATILLFLLLFFIAVSVIYSAGTLYIQAFLYEQPPQGLYWRGPAAAGALTLVLALWLTLDYFSPGKYRTVFEFSPHQDLKPFEELRVPNARGGEDIFYLVPDDRGRGEYRLGGDRDGRLFPSQPKKFFAMEGDAKVVFEAQEMGVGQYQEYEDEEGRTIVAGSWDQVSHFRTGWMFANLFLNLLFFVVLVVSIWLILSFHGLHAFWLACAVWVALILFVIPPMLTSVEDTAREAGIKKVTTRPPIESLEST